MAAVPVGPVGAPEEIVPVPDRVAFLCDAVAHGGASRGGAARIASLLRQELGRWIGELADVGPDTGPPARPD